MGKTGSKRSAERAFPCVSATSGGSFTILRSISSAAGVHTLAAEVSGTTDLLTALRIWVNDNGSTTYFNWMADAQDENYPVFEVLYTVTVENGTGSGSYRAGDTVSIQANAPTGSQIFDGWTSADSVAFADPASAATSFVMPGKDVTVTATYRQRSTPTADYYTLRFETNGGSEVASVRRADGSRVSLNQTTVRAGYVFTGWYLDAALTQRAGAVTLDRDKTVYAGWRRDAADPDDTGVSERLDTGAHEKYLTGYPDGDFRPERPMTRAEAAQMFYNLLLDKPAAVSAGFADVELAAWYAEAVNALAVSGILRGESENRFAPEQSITRAEAAAVVNRMLARSGDENYIRTHLEALTRFGDLTADHWAYFEITEAANGHDYDRLDGREYWKAP